MYLTHLPENLVQPFLNLAYTLIATDGIIHKQEKEDLAALAKEMQLPELPKCKIVDYKEALGDFDSLENAVKRELYFELLMLVYADARFNSREKVLLDFVAEHFKISKADSMGLEMIAKSPKKDGRKLEAILYTDPEDN